MLSVGCWLLDFFHFPRAGPEASAPGLLLPHLRLDPIGLRARSFSAGRGAAQGQLANSRDVEVHGFGFVRSAERVAVPKFFAIGDDIKLGGIGRGTGIDSDARGESGVPSFLIKFRKRV